MVGGTVDPVEVDITGVTGGGTDCVRTHAANRAVVVHIVERATDNIGNCGGYTTACSQCCNS